MFGAPNTWRLEPTGKLTRSLETEEYKSAVGYVRDLVGMSLFHPNVLSYNINSARADFIAGRFIVYPEGFGNPWNDFWRRGLQQTPPVNFLLIPPFAATDGGTPQHYLSVGYQATTALKKASPERTKELLRILNWLATPFGSQEDLLLTAGIKDVDYHLDDRGNPVLTDRGNTDANYVPWKYIVQHPQVMYVPDIPNYAQTLYEAEQTLIPHGVADPTLGFYSPASSTKGLAVNQTFTDGITDVMAGRRPMTDFDGLVRDWRANGGDQIRSEYEQAIAAAKA
jgi:putative aldouronate transport system substrate-binding protein